MKRIRLLADAWIVSSVVTCESAVHVSSTDKLIGVHCTHGLNRTGYLICRCVPREARTLNSRCVDSVVTGVSSCRYLIDVDGMDPKEAVEREY